MPFVPQFPFGCNVPQPAGDVRELPHHLINDERAAIFIADAYAKISGRVGLWSKADSFMQASWMRRIVG